MSLNIDTFNTGIIEDNLLVKSVEQLFDLRPAAIIHNLDLKKPIYKRFAAYGHFGREDNCAWEKLDMISKLKEEVIKYENI